MSSLNTTASWIIRRRDTKEVVMETFSLRTAQAVRPEFEAVPILEYLQSLNVKESAA